MVKPFVFLLTNSQLLNLTLNDIDQKIRQMQELLDKISKGRQVKQSSSHPAPEYAPPEAKSMLTVEE